MNFHIFFQNKLNNKSNEIFRKRLFIREVKQLEGKKPAQETSFVKIN